MKATAVSLLLNNPKIVYVLRRLSDTFLTGKNEGVSVGGALSVEHILPQTWQNNWPLRDGSKGLTQLELLTSPKDDPRAEATRERNQIIQTLGNLTIEDLAARCMTPTLNWRTVDSKPHWSSA